MTVWWDVLLWLFASPILFVKWLCRQVQRWGFWQASYAARMTCRNCRAAISLVGIWRCRCGYTYRGHVLRACPVCFALPRMVRCYACGVTERLPEP